MYIYLKYSIYKKNMRLAGICIKYYTADHHSPLNISCNCYFKIKKIQMQWLFPNAGADEKPGIFVTWPNKKRAPLGPC
jgi:hypothetical protein